MGRNGIAMRPISETDRGGSPDRFQSLSNVENFNFSVNNLWKT